MSTTGHIPVLLDETLRVLAPKPGDVAVDCTFGRGGHALALAKAVGAGGTVVGIDLDAANLEHGRRHLSHEPAKFIPIHGSFADIEHHLASHNLKADVALADLGIASSQLDDPTRGLSFSHDGPLDMRLDSAAESPTAANLLAMLSETELADIIYQLGEEPYSRRIARKLVEARRQSPITSTSRLASLVREAYGSRAFHSRVHPATRTFMALRIAVNAEHQALQALLDAVARAAADSSRTPWLSPHARIAIISFHSLEDRPVKHAFAQLVRNDRASALTRKPITPDDEEVARNPRARSAKLRAISLHSAAHIP